MKRFLLTCVALLAFTTTAFAYKVGDIIMVGGEMGIVYAVTSDGQHGKVVSVMEGWCDWEAAKQWCAQHGRGWRLPSKEDLWVIYRKKGVLNQILTANGYTALYGWCWSSTEYDTNRAWGVSMRSGYHYASLKSNYNEVHAVSVF